MNVNVPLRYRYYLLYFYGRKSSKCNTIFEENFGRGAPTETFSRTGVQKLNDHIQLRLRQSAEIIALREEKAQQTVGVFVCAALPRLVRVRKIHRRPDMLLQKPELCELRAVVQRNASYRVPRQQPLLYSLLRIRRPRLSYS